jgi:hypothetical protein
LLDRLTYVNFNVNIKDTQKRAARCLRNDVIFSFASFSCLFVEKKRRFLCIRRSSSKMFDCCIFVVRGQSRFNSPLFHVGFECHPHEIELCNIDASLMEIAFFDVRL